MAITPYRPMMDLFRPVLDDFMVPSRWGGRMGDLLRVPDADVMETENELRVVVELPGMKAQDVNVDLENNVLTITGEKREERTEGDDKDRWHLSERRYGRFTRSFVLPREVEQDSIDARFEDGVLTVTIPKSEQAKRRRIEVTSGTAQNRLEAGGER